ncbi:hypothetical protein VTK26DRAFT_627 [Humicola hyalothermophila]
MPPTSRSYYLTTSPSRDFTWFSFRAAAAPRLARYNVEPTAASKLPKNQHTKMPITEQPGQAIMAPQDVKAKAEKGKARLDAPRPKKPKPKKSATKQYGIWSDWYVSEDRNYFWRARQATDETWDYQYTPGANQRQEGEQQQEQQQPLEPQINILTASGNELIRPLSPPSPGPDPNHLRVPDPASPKSSWPTIITTSTGYPTEAITTSSNQTLTTIPKEVADGSSGPAGANSALVPLAPTSKTPRYRGAAAIASMTTVTKPRRPVGPVMRLIQEGRSRQKAKSAAAKSNNKSAQPQHHHHHQQQQQQQRHQHPVIIAGGGQAQRATVGRGNDNNNGRGSGVVTGTKMKARAAYVRKLHAKVKAEKELRADPKRRVRVWLRGVEMDGVVAPLDAEGLPVYR